MNIFALTDPQDIEKLLMESDRLADRIGSPFPAHRFRLPLSWWQHYSSENGADFGKNRGRNFFGSRSWLERLFFVVAEQNGTLVGIAPLFISKVIIKGLPEPIRLVSFCPDSSLLFYQDFLIHPVDRAMVVNQLFRFIAAVLDAENLILFLGHIPVSSPNVPLIQHEINQFVGNGWKGGETVNCWRGGVYPWNIGKLCNALRALQEKTTKNKNGVHAEITACIHELESQTSALLLFANTRKKLEERIMNILMKLEGEPDLSPVLHSVSELFDTKPIRYPFLHLPANTDEFYTRLSSAKRYFYRRYLKQFISAGGSFETLAPETIQPEDIDTYIELHMSRWQGASAAFHKKTIQFHQEASMAMAESGYFRLFFARYHDKRIAALSCFDICGTREFYYSGRTMGDTRLRAGKLLVLHSIVDAINNGFSFFDFGFGGDEYKFDFTEDYKTLKSFFLSKNMELSFLDQLFPLYEKITIT